MTKRTLAVITVCLLVCLTSTGYCTEPGNVSDTAELHEQLSEYSRPILQWRTENFLVRVDEMSEYSYRYASWSADATQSDEPDLILYGGELIMDGSGGNRHYEFTNSGYRYEVHLVYIGTGEAPGFLYVYQGDELLLREPVVEQTLSPY